MLIWVILLSVGGFKKLELIWVIWKIQVKGLRRAHERWCVGRDRVQTGFDRVCFWSGHGGGGFGKWFIYKGLGGMVGRENWVCFPKRHDH